MSIWQKARIHMHFQITIIKRGREGVGVDYWAGLQKDQLCVPWHSCIINTEVLKSDG